MGKGLAIARAKYAVGKWSYEFFNTFDYKSIDWMNSIKKLNVKNLSWDNKVESLTMGHFTIELVCYIVYTIVRFPGLMDISGIKKGQ